ncbi:hypothetical protein CR513_31317, partial [Mucuna pruriens]
NWRCISYHGKEFENAEFKSFLEKLQLLFIKNSSTKQDKLPVNCGEEENLTYLTFIHFDIRSSNKVADTTRLAHAFELIDAKDE